MDSASMGASTFIVVKAAKIVATAALLFVAMSGCSIGKADRERAYFSSTERCQDYFASELRTALSHVPIESDTGVEFFLNSVNGHAKGDVAKVLEQSARDYRSAFSGRVFVLPLDDVQRKFAYQLVADNVILISQCRNLDAHISTYLLADQLRLLAQESRVTIDKSKFSVDVGNMDEVSKALLASLVAERSIAKL